MKVKAVTQTWYDNISGMKKVPLKACNGAYISIAAGLKYLLLSQWPWTLPQIFHNNFYKFFQNT